MVVYHPTERRGTNKDELPGWCPAVSRAPTQTQRCHPSRTPGVRAHRHTSEGTSVPNGTLGGTHSFAGVIPLQANHPSPAIRIKARGSPSSDLHSFPALAGSSACSCSSIQSCSIFLAPFPVESGCFLPTAFVVIANTQGRIKGEKETFINPGNLV